MNNFPYELPDDWLDASIPKQIGPYLIEQLIERGHVHESYRGFDPTRSEPVFIKRLQPHAHLSSQGLGNFSREIRLLRTINHPGILRFIQAGMEGGQPYFVAEYLEGSNLREFLIYELPRPSEAYFILRQIAAALSYLHEKQFVHNDIKPENIRISPLLKATLIDFGIAQSLEKQEDAKTRQLAGTLLYMSPEQQTQNEISAASDLYSFAIIAYELLCGRLSHGMVQLANLPQPLQPIFAKALQNDPKQRFKSINDFLVCLENVKYCVPGLHLPMRRNRENDLLFDSIPKLWPLDALAVEDHSKPKTGAFAKLHFVRGMSFQAERSLLGARVYDTHLIYVFVDAHETDPGWLYYLKAELDHLADDQWSPEALQQFLDFRLSSLHISEAPPTLSLAVVQLQKNTEHLLSVNLWLKGSMMIANVEPGQVTQYKEATSDWVFFHNLPSALRQLYIFPKRGGDALQLTGIIDSACTVHSHDLENFCHFASRTLGDYLARLARLQNEYPIDIKTLYGSIPILGIQIQDATIWPG